MKLLSVSPDVVVAGSYPFEVMLAGYYAQAHSVLTSPGDHQASSNPSNIWEDPFRVGVNPFYHRQYLNVLDNPNALYDILGRRAQLRIRDALRDTVLTVYQSIVQSKGVPKAMYFAEKSTLHRPVREALKIIFDTPKEILLVRDLRDIYCSSRAFWPVRNDLFDIMNDVHARYMDIIEEASPATLVVRYEDLVLDRSATAQRIATFLGLTEVPQLDAETETELFRQHGTSVDPVGSVGRWKRDLTPSERKMFAERFAHFFKVCSYET